MARQVPIHANLLEKIYDERGGLWWKHRECGYCWQGASQLKIPVILSWDTPAPTTTTFNALSWTGAKMTGVTADSATVKSHGTVILSFRSSFFTPPPTPVPNLTDRLRGRFSGRKHLPKKRKKNPALICMCVGKEEFVCVCVCVCVRPVFFYPTLSHHTHTQVSTSVRPPSFLWQKEQFAAPGAVISQLKVSRTSTCCTLTTQWQHCAVQLTDPAVQLIDRDAMIKCGCT